MKVQLPEYAGRLAAFGDPVLDALAATEKPPAAPRVKIPVPERCPSCGRVRILKRGHIAVICEECHAGIAECVSRRLWK